MKKMTVFFLALSLLLGSSSALAELERNKYIDAAFEALEAGNPFVARYNELTGANIEPLYDTGIPYFFGGQDVQYLYMVKRLTQNSQYGRIGDKYIYGFDCVGYTRWIQERVGDKLHPKLSAMILQHYKYRDYRIAQMSPVPEPSQISSILIPGDFLVAKHKGRHILMFIGTLEDYGYDAQSAPELKDYLDYPLMINCGNDPNYIARTAAYIEQNGLSALPSKGGVTVSIVGMSETDAPHVTIEGAAKPFYYFELGDYQLSVYDFPGATSHGNYCGSRY